MGKVKKQTPEKAGQIGMVVRDAKAAAGHFTRLYRIGSWYRADFREKQVFYRGREVELDAEILIGFSNGMEIELIQMNNDAENIYSDILRKQDGGIHHIGFFVTGYDRKLAEMKAMGVEALQWGTLKTRGGAVTRFAYFDTVRTCGTVTEYIETRFLGVPVPHNSFMMKISTITGDLKKVDL